MSEEQNELAGFNRRDFLKGGSVATLMAMLGGVEIVPPRAGAAENESAASTAAANPDDSKKAHYTGRKVALGVIGLGTWGREILNSLSRDNVAELCTVAALCDTYESAITRASKDMKDVIRSKDYKTILDDKSIDAVVVATPTHLHKEIAVEALKAGKHVYCEVPLAHTIEDARAIASAAKAAPKQVFQAGLQNRSDKGRLYALTSFMKSGAVGPVVMARAQWHRNNSWRMAAANSDREKALNWRLDKKVSLGLIGEIGIHQLDQTSWFLNGLPNSFGGFGSVVFYKDGRDVPDTIQAVAEYPGSVRLVYDATLANSFDAAYEIIYGNYAAMLFRDNRQWLFQEVNTMLLGWEIYAMKEEFYKQTGIVIAAGASKSTRSAKAPAKAGSTPPPAEDTVLMSALGNFLWNVADLREGITSAQEAYAGDEGAIAEQLTTVRAEMNKKHPAAGYLQGYQATVAAIKANEAVAGNKRVEVPRELYELS
jgi:predicted dehydrogenase